MSRYSREDRARIALALVGTVAVFVGMTIADHDPRKSQYPTDSRAQTVTTLRNGTGCFVDDPDTWHTCPASVKLPRTG